MHIVERKQESLSNSFTQSVMKDISNDDSDDSKITLEVKPRPIVQDD